VESVETFAIDISAQDNGHHVVVQGLLGDSTEILEGIVGAAAVI
jgi:hypothetical protein